MAGVSVPMTVNIGFPNVFFKFVNVAVIVFTHSTYDTFLVPLVTLSFHGAVRSIVTADGRLPVLFLVPFPNFFVDSVIGTANVVFANVTFSVVVFVNVIGNINSGNVVSAVCSVPMLFLVGRPSVCLVCMLVIVVPGANVTDAVVIEVGVLTLVLNVDGVRTAYVVPMLSFVVRPLCLIGVLVIVVPGANVADTVDVFINVRAVSIFYVVLTGGSVPVMRSIVSVVGLIGVLVIVVPFAHVANAVVVLVLVRLAVLGVYVTVTGGKEIVVSLVV